MTGDVMVDMLGLRLEDPAESSFTSDAKVKAVNLAEKTVVNLINNAYLTELQFIDAAVVPATGVVELDGTGDNSTTAKPVRNSIISVYDNTNSRYATMIEAQDAPRTKNTLLSSASNTIAYVFQNKLYIIPSSVASVDIWYLKEPSGITDGSGSESVLNEALHEVVLDFAESQLWRMDNQGERAAAAYQAATNQINALNARYEGEAPEGIGTKGRR
jgi:hypothetical protein